MQPERKSLTRWWRVAVLGVCLSLGTAEAGSKDKDRAQRELAQCAEQCDTAAEEKAEACLKKCPLPRGNNAEAFQACSQRCLNVAANDKCHERCERAASKKEDAAAERGKKGQSNPD